MTPSQARAGTRSATGAGSRGTGRVFSLPGRSPCFASRFFLVTGRIVARSRLIFRRMWRFFPRTWRFLLRTCRILRGTCRIQRGTCRIYPGTCRIHRGSRRILASARRILPRDLSYPFAHVSVSCSHVPSPSAKVAYLLGHLSHLSVNMAVPRPEETTPWARVSHAPAKDTTPGPVDTTRRRERSYSPLDGTTGSAQARAPWQADATAPSKPSPPRAKQTPACAPLAVSRPDETTGSAHHASLAAQPRRRHVDPPTHPPRACTTRRQNVGGRADALGPRAYGRALAWETGAPVTSGSRRAPEARRSARERARTRAEHG